MKDLQANIVVQQNLFRQRKKLTTNFNDVYILILVCNHVVKLWWVKAKDRKKHSLYLIRCRNFEELIGSLNIWICKASAMISGSEISFFSHFASSKRIGWKLNQVYFVIKQMFFYWTKIACIIYSLHFLSYYYVCLASRQ